MTWKTCMIYMWTATKLIKRLIMMESPTWKEKDNSIKSTPQGNVLTKIKAMHWIWQWYSI